MKRYGSLPLLYQPGERWALQQRSGKFLGVLIARVAGTTPRANFLIGPHLRTVGE